jgi:hypothetical protein
MDGELLAVSTSHLPRDRVRAVLGQEQVPSASRQIAGQPSAESPNQWIRIKKKISAQSASQDDALCQHISYFGMEGAVYAR